MRPMHPTNRYSEPALMGEGINAQKALLCKCIRLGSVAGSTVGTACKALGVAADRLRHMLVPRFRFQQRLSASVDMTSNVKSGQQIFLGLHEIFNLGASAEPEPAIGDG